MKDIGRMYTAQMVKALLRQWNPKTQTRRIDGLEFINADPDAWKVWEGGVFDDAAENNRMQHPRSTLSDPVFIRKDGFVYRPVIDYKVGRMIYVRETLRRAELNGVPGVQYSADGAWAWNVNEPHPWEWQRSVLPAIHCPRRLSRVFLRITDVRFQRLRDMSAFDAVAEGITSKEMNFDLVGEATDDIGMCRMWFGVPNVGNKDPIMAFSDLWESINGERGEGRCSWGANPWVCAVTFERR